MLMADVFSITLTIVGFLLSLQGLWLLSRALWPNRVARAGVRANGQRFRSVLVGVGVTLLMVVLTAISGGALGALGQAMAFALVSLWILYASVGVAGLATELGRQLGSPVDVERPWRTTVRGGVALELAFLFPILGWLILLPLSLVLGTGAVTLSFFDRRLPAPGGPTKPGGARPTITELGANEQHDREPVEAMS